MLDHIKMEKCDICGSEVREQVRKSRHSNGEWNEYCAFFCGRELHYSPYSKKVFESTICRESREYKDFIKKRNEAGKKIDQFVSNLDVDEKFKHKIFVRTRDLF